MIPVSARCCHPFRIFDRPSSPQRFPSDDSACWFCSAFYLFYEANCKFLCAVPLGAPAPASSFFKKSFQSAPLKLTAWQVPALARLLCSAQLVKTCTTNYEVIITGRSWWLFWPWLGKHSFLSVHSPWKRKKICGLKSSKTLICFTHHGKAIKTHSNRRTVWFLKVFLYFKEIKSLKFQNVPDDRAAV